jgi:prepilin-type N-terminal cleavage/methylation domain-containing protein
MFGNPGQPVVASDAQTARPGSVTPRRAGRCRLARNAQRGCRTTFAEGYPMRALIRGLRRGLERGMTLLEIMIVLAILAIVMGLIVGPPIIERFSDARRQLAEIAVKKYVFEAYPAWVALHPDKDCPATLEELSPFTNGKSTHDPWGGTYTMYCGANLPAGVSGFAVSSPGRDRKHDTSDDIRSWD